MSFFSGASFANGKRVSATVLEHTGDAHVMDQHLFFAKVRTETGEEVEVTFESEPPEAGTTISARLGMPVFDNELAEPVEYGIRKIHEIGSTNAMPTFLDVREASPDEQLNTGARGAWAQTANLPVPSNIVVDEENLFRENAADERAQQRLLENSEFYRALRAELVRQGTQEIRFLDGDMKLQKKRAAEAGDGMKSAISSGAFLGVVADIFLTAGTATLTAAVVGGVGARILNDRDYGQKRRDALSTRRADEHKITTIHAEMAMIRATDPDTGGAGNSYDEAGPSRAV